MPEPPSVTLVSSIRPILDGGYRMSLGTLGVLGLLGPLRKFADDYERELVIDARREGASWDEIGAALGVPRQTAHRRHAGAAK